MTPDVLRETLARLGISHTGAARLLGIDARTMRRWLSGSTDVPEIASRLLGLLVRDPSAIDALQSMTGD